MRAFVSFACVLLLSSGSASSEEPAPTSSEVKGMTISGAPLTEDSCEVVVSVNGQKPELREAPGLHVLDKSESNPLVLTSTEDNKVLAIICWRSEAQLAPNDYLVPGRARVTLFIRTDTGNEATDRAIALEKSGGSYRVRMLSGPEWSKAEEREMIQAMTSFNKRS
jgi:hypothetical protein